MVVATLAIILFSLFKTSQHNCVNTHITPVLFHGDRCWRIIAKNKYDGK